MIIQGNDPYREASFALGSRLRRQLWYLVQASLFRFSLRPLHGWRSFLLRLFGAKLGVGCHVYPGVKIWAPWNLSCGAFVGIADGVTLYSMDLITIGDYAVISQGAHLCTGTHDYNSRNFQLVTRPITIGAHAWVCAEAFLHPGVVLPDGVVIGARSVVTKSVPQAWAVYAGNPCVIVKQRTPSVDRRGS